MTALEVVAIITTCVCMVFDCICLWVYFCCVFFPRTSCIEVVYFWGSSVIGFFFFSFYIYCFVYHVGHSRQSERSLA